MTLSLIRRLACLAALAALIGGPTLTSSAQDDDVPRSKRKAPPKADPGDDDVIVPGKKKAPAPTGGGAQSLEALLKQANLKYETVESQDGSTGYRIPITVNNQKTMVFAREIAMGKRKDGAPIKAAMLGTMVAQFPTGYKPALPVYKAVTDFNNGILFGKGMIDSQGILYMNVFWLRTADTQTLFDHLYFVHESRLNLRKRVQPTMEEEE